MELFCPNCQRKLTIPDQYAGQLMKCPLCAGTFTTPVLGPVSTPAPPVAEPPPPETIPLPAPTPSPPTEGNLPPSPPPVSLEQPAAPPPPEVAASTALAPVAGEYAHSWTLVLNPLYVPWIAPSGLTLLFLLSFTVWYGTNRGEVDAPWHWAFTPGPDVPWLAFLFYLIFTVFLAWPLSIASLLLDLRVFSLPASMASYLPLRPIVMGSLALLGFLPLLAIYVPASINVFNDFGTLSLRLAVRIHLVVLIGLALEWWLERRRQQNLPPPSVEVRW